MNQPTPSRSPQQHYRGADASPGSRMRVKPVRLLIFLAFFLAFMLRAQGPARAQLVANPSFENITTATCPTPNWPSGATSETAIAGTNGWFTRYYSPDIFWPTNYVPSNFMTAWNSPLNAFDGTNYAGISTGRFTAGFITEILAGTLTANPVGIPYTVHARFAMGTVRNNPAMVRVSLDGPSGPFVVGFQMVSSPQWTPFSQIINLPSSDSYDRIVIEGVDSTASSSYVFIDSVDITPLPGPCAYLHASVQSDPTAGSCCWNLYIDNSLPAILGSVYGIRLTAVTPNPLAGPATNGTGWTSTTTMSTTVNWTRGNGGPDPLGSGQYVGTYCLNPTTSPQTQIIDFLGKDGAVLCSDTIVTDCMAEPGPCMEFGTPQISCGPLDSLGQQTYNVSVPMSVLNGLNGYVTLTSPNGTVTPGSFNVPPYSQWVNMIFTDTPPLDSHVCIYTTQHVYNNGVDSIACRDTLCFDLPQCPHDCCLDFLKQISQQKISYSNGTVNLSGCIMAGPNQIKRFSATIVAAQARNKCIGPWAPWHRIFGDIIASTLGAPLSGPQFVPTMTFSREVVWGGPASPVCVSFNPCVNYTLKMIFPNPPAGACKDSLRFAVRYSFTDCNCVTCDTIVYYQFIRKYSHIIWGGGVPPTDPPVLSGGHVLPDPGLLNITMSSERRGTLSVTLPDAADGDPHIRITGMQLRPEGVGLSRLVQQGTSNSARIVGNMADISYTLDEGNTALFDLNYYNGNDDYSIRNLMVFRYVDLSDTTSDTTYSDTLEVYTTTPNGGGDVVEPTSSSTTDVRTYALHLVASNALGSAVDAVRLHVNGGATLIAVGPVGNGTDAALKSGVDDGGNSVVQVDKDTWTVENVESGSTLDPIYLTFAGVGDNTVSVDYSTIDASGAAISSGSTEISSPLRVAGVDPQSAEAGPMLMPVFPNPSTHSATVQFDLQSAAHVSVVIRDVRGAEVLRPIDRQDLGAGRHLVPVDTRRLPAGTYVVVMDADGLTYTRPMTVVR